MSKHVVIIGAGVVGLCTAYYAARKGHRVTVLDRAANAGEGCSYGNAGMVVPSHFVPLAAPGMVALGLKWMWNPESPFYVRPRFSGELLSWGIKFWRAANAEHVLRSAPVLRDLHSASRACFEELDELWGRDFGLSKEGMLILCKTVHGFHEEAEVAERARRLGIAATVHDAGELAGLEPEVRMDVAGAIRYPMDCHLTPGHLMAALVREVKTAGVHLSWGTQVRGFRTQDRRVEALSTASGEVSGDEYVLCAGIWSHRIARELDLAIPMEAGKGYSLTLPAPRATLRHCAILSEARVAVTPMGSALRFGGTMELSGIDSSIDPARVRGIVNAATRYYPDFTADDFAGVAPWCGLRPCSPDGLPYVGRFGHYDNLSAATGHAMMGVSLGPITGKLMAEILSGEKPSLDIESLSPNRYS
ncbi:NAD(P)/FAD-dependent oxidoreductase [Pendulispora albinea]|uniref:FAD-dependent oxidoreductase n=1 Tax=Pendulispora albinea TaxID=2741071 RepID=A0ABZ2M636_9BACT